MTTIAYKDGIIAYDSRYMVGSLIMTDKAQKMIIVNDVVFVFSGCTCDQERFVALYFDNSIDHTGIECSAMAVDNGKLLSVGIEGKTGLFRSPLDKHECHAMGSGAPHALTAMDMGTDSRTAIKVAMRRDSATGGKIRHYKIDKKQGEKI